MEIVENQAPVLIEYTRLVTDSGGAGRQRGGLGQEMAIHMVAGDSMIFSLRPDKVRHPPPGVLGGLPALAGDYALNGKPVAVEPLALKPGDIYTIRLPGGGGYGNPAERSRALVRDDVADGYVSAEAAARLYGLAQD